MRTGNWYPFPSVRMSRVQVLFFSHKADAHGLAPLKVDLWSEIDLVDSWSINFSAQVMNHHFAERLKGTTCSRPPP